MSYKELIVWQRAMDLVIDVYRTTKSFPKEETYGLVAQMRRAAVSVPSNIAEGRGRYSRKELVQFLINARGSLLELETQVEIGKVLGYLGQTERNKLMTLSSEVGKLLNGTISHFKQQAQSQEHVAL
jgi:four helix bundle protein